RGGGGRERGTRRFLCGATSYVTFWLSKVTSTIALSATRKRRRLPSSSVSRIPLRSKCSLKICVSSSVVDSKTAQDVRWRVTSCSRKTSEGKPIAASERLPSETGTRKT